VLVLLTGGIYEVRHWDSLRLRHIYSKFYGNLFRYSSDIKIITLAISKAAIFVLLMGRICELCRWDAFRGMIYVPSVMESGTGVQAILKFYNILRARNIGISDRRDLWNTLLRWAQVPWCTFHKDRIRLSEVVGGD
jgi:hypothetical protein